MSANVASTPGVHKQRENQAGAEKGVEHSLENQDKDECLGALIGMAREESGQDSLVLLFDMRSKYRKREVDFRVQKDFPGAPATPSLIQGSALLWSGATPAGPGPCHLRWGLLLLLWFTWG